MSENKNSHQPAKPGHADFIVLGRIVTMNADRDIISDGALAVVGGEIAAVGRRADIEERFSAERTLGDDRAIIIPGLIANRWRCQSLYS